MHINKEKFYGILVNLLVSGAIVFIGYGLLTSTSSILHGIGIVYVVTVGSFIFLGLSGVIKFSVNLVIESRED